MKKTGEFVGGRSGNKDWSLVKRNVGTMTR